MGERKIQFSPTKNDEVVGEGVWEDFFDRQKIDKFALSEKLMKRVGGWKFNSFKGRKVRGLKVSGEGLLEVF